MSFNVKEVVPLQHHAPKDICATRPKYRQGRKDTAVKVYTINQESKYLIIIGVPAVGALEELQFLCGTFGDIDQMYPLDDYPCEEFTETYLVGYERIQSARIAKRKLDTRSFFGGILHICYAPEFETPEETRAKLMDRQKYVSIKTQSGFTGPWDTRLGYSKPSQPTTTVNPTPSLSVPSTEETTYIWAGKTYTLSQAADTQPVEPVPHVEQCAASSVRQTTTQFVPRQLQSAKRKFDTASTSTQDSSVRSLVESSSAEIWNKVSKLSAPSLDVSFKRKKHK